METKPPVGKGLRRLTLVEVPGLGSGFVCRRKTAIKFLRELRCIGEVRMLTSAMRVYAEAMNVVFDLGFAPTEIVAREELNAEDRRAVDPSGVLIDNAAQFDRDDAHYLARRRKRLYLGIESNVIVEVPYFDGLTDDSFDREWRTYTAMVRKIVRRQ